MTKVNPLGHLLAFAAERNVALAARQLGISELDLERSIKLLEEQLGLKLIEGKIPDLSVTESGQNLARFLLDELDRIDMEVTNQKKGTMNS